MEEVGVSVAVKLAEYLVDPIVRPIRYFWNYKSNYKNLEAEVEKLKDAKERIHHSIVDAKRKGEEIERDVENWLIRANETFDEAGKVFEDDNQANNRCFKGLCPNFKAHYRFSKEAVREVEAVVELLEEGKFSRVSFKPIPEEIWPPIKSYEVFESRMSTLKNILNELINPDVNIIGVYGMGGVGKTMLVKHVAREAKKNKLFDEVVYVVVSEDLDVKKIQGEIADELGLEFSEESENGRARRLRARLQREKKVLIILDNIWRHLDLDAVGIPFGEAHKGCKILLTSRSQEVVSNEMDSQIDFSVGVLNEEEAWLLFKKMTGDYIENNDLLSVAKDVVKVCAGLPIAIVTTARALRNKSVSVWNDALLQLKRPSPGKFIGMQVPYSTIELSYDRLEDEELKSTFLLCSLMGFNYSALITDLVKYGMGLRLYEGINTMQEARDRVYTLVYKLKASCLLLDSSTSEKFAMHDLVRDVAISIARRDRNMFAVRNEVLPKDWLINVPKNCTAMSLRSNDISELPEELECPHLQFFYVYSKDLFLRIPDNFFEGMTELRVLDLTKLHILLLPSSLQLLVNLHTLCLDRCILRDLSIIGNLKKLEILSFLRSDIEQLPGEISQLTQLRLLDLTGCSKLKVIPPNVISSLSQLEVLYIGHSFVNWEVEGCDNERCNASLDELKHLSNLTTLDIHVHDAKILPKGLFSEKLERYRIFIGDEWDWSGNYETSRTLKLKLNTSIFPEDNIISQLKGVEDLYLDELHGVENVLNELDGEGFPQLKHLHAQNNPYFLCIVDSAHWVPHNAFPLLESMFLCNLINMEKICRGQLTAGSFCKLRTIKVENCSKLKNIFSFSIARGLPQLETIEVNGCSNMEEIFAIENEDEINDNEATEKIEFSQLRSLTLKSLPCLTSFCSKVKSSNLAISEDDLDIPTALFSEKVAFPNLEVLELFAINFEKMWHNQLPVQYLEICKCVVLEEIIFIDEFRGEETKDMIFPRLNYLKIEQCPELKAFISEKNSTDLTTSKEEGKMRSVEVHQDGIEPFFNGKVIFPNLEELVISHMDSLEMIWHDQVGESSFCKLKLVKVECCNKLQAVFTCNLRGRFSSLKSLTVSDCGLLEEIFQIQGPNFEGTNCAAETQLRYLHIKLLPKLRHIWSKDSIGSASFQNLRVVTVSECQRLRNVFPASIASSLLHLQELEINTCGVEEIVAVDEVRKETVFVFPQVTSLKLSNLAELKLFYPGIHTSKWPMLKKLAVYHCDKVKIFASEFNIVQDDNGEYQLDLQTQQPLFMVEKVITNLEKLTLSGKDCQSQFPEYLFRNLKALEVVADESTAFPLGFLQRFHNLEELALSFSSYKEIFLHGEAQKHAGTLAQIKTLKLSSLSDLKYIWKQESKLDLILQNLEILNISHCENLINLIPSSATLENLTTLDISSCKGLINLVTPFTAKSLVQLVELNVYGCEMMTEIIANEGDATEDEIIFSKLKRLSLDHLPSLTSFYYGNHTFKFPSLEEFILRGCPTMNIFCRGVLSTPRLRKVQLTLGVDKEYWEGDLNTTIQHLARRNWYVLVH
ncbi:probable disease resistance protein At4g27220 isoform X2 [Pistacia vera]|uniref:probable disease resistance protein At4g27220 isoform X2 n=1 Tax=Pistacia vera TaxID=55513 RepID=UPI001263AB02|nr:probable disease resistance protein At4g27220 isoform X2 [Pistacia vera]